MNLQTLKLLRIVEHLPVFIEIGEILEIKFKGKRQANTYFKKDLIDRF